MPANKIPLAKETGRVPSVTVPLDGEQERRYQRLMDEVIMIDVHQHPMVLPEDLGRFTEYLRSNNYRWGYQAVKGGGWTAVATANFFRGLMNTPELSFVDFQDVLGEIDLMLADVSQHQDVLKVTNAGEIESAKQQGKVGFLPTL
jgi:membrane dipeptidase